MPLCVFPSAASTPIRLSNSTFLLSRPHSANTSRSDRTREACAAMVAATSRVRSGLSSQSFLKQRRFFTEVLPGACRLGSCRLEPFHQAASLPEVYRREPFRLATCRPAGCRLVECYQARSAVWFRPKEREYSCLDLEVGPRRPLSDCREEGQNGNAYTVQNEPPVGHCDTSHNYMGQAQRHNRNRCSL
jgi:hypothetical protein